MELTQMTNPSPHNRLSRSSYGETGSILMVHIMPQSVRVRPEIPQETAGLLF
jgi:hypothetical protein